MFMAKIKNQKIFSPRFALYLFIIIVFAFFLGWQNTISSPEYAAYQMFKAVREKDYQKFEKYADVDSIAEKGVDEFAKKFPEKSPLKLNLNVLNIVGLNLSHEIDIAAMKPAAVENVKNGIREAVEEGYIKGASYSEDSLVKAMQEIKSEKEDGFVRITVPIDEKPFYMNMRKINGHWEVFEIDINSPSIKAAYPEK